MVDCADSRSRFPDLAAFPGEVTLGSETQSEVQRAINRDRVGTVPPASLVRVLDLGSATRVTSGLRQAWRCGASYNQGHPGCQLFHEWHPQMHTRRSKRPRIFCLHEHAYDPINNNTGGPAAHLQVCRVTQAKDTRTVVPIHAH